MGEVCAKIGGKLPTENMEFKEFEEECEQHDPEK